MISSIASGKNSTVALRVHTEVRALETRLLHHVNLQDVRGSLSAEGMDAIWQMVDVMRWGLSRL